MSPAISHAASSLGSSNGSSSASSYVSFGSRRGRRAVFDKNYRVSRDRSTGPPPTKIRYPAKHRSRAHSQENLASSTSYSPPHQTIFPKMDAAKVLATSPTLSKQQHQQQRQRNRRLELYVEATFSETEPKNVAETQTSEERQQKAVDNLYHCTFCPASLKTRYTWKRHEESVHMPSRVWRCAPTPSVPHGRCPICWAGTTNEGWMIWDDCPHGFSSCWEKPEMERTFLRADALKQHILSAHCKKSGSPYPSTMDLGAWSAKVAIPDPDLQCYFCGYLCEDWSQRARHVGRHFYHGMKISMWKTTRNYIADKTEHGLDFSKILVQDWFSRLSVFRANASLESLILPIPNNLDEKFQLKMLVVWMGSDFTWGKSVRVHRVPESRQTGFSRLGEKILDMGDVFKSLVRSKTTGGSLLPT